MKTETRTIEFANHYKRMMNAGDFISFIRKMPFHFSNMVEGECLRICKNDLVRMVASVKDRSFKTDSRMVDMALVRMCTDMISMFKKRERFLTVVFV